MKKIETLAVAVLVGTLVTFGSAHAADRIHKAFDIPASLEATLQATNCGGSPGPQVSLQGNLILSGLNVEVIFRNTGPQVSQEPFVVEQVVVPAEQQVSTPAQSIVGGIGSNPYIWLEIVDAKGRPLTSEMFLGRCEQGTFTATANFRMPAEAIGDVTATECSTAPAVTFDGSTELSALTGRLIFRSSNELHPTGQVDQSITDVMVMAAGQTYPLPAQPVVANAGTNPQISLQFRQADGSAAGTEVRLGRCSTLTIQ
jgi:hypothetical protein